MGIIAVLRRRSGSGSRFFFEGVGCRFQIFSPNFWRFTCNSLTVSTLATTHTHTRTHAHTHTHAYTRTYTHTRARYSYYTNFFCTQKTRNSLILRTLPTSQFSDPYIPHFLPSLTC